jgi:hypothetical protein
MSSDELENMRSNDTGSESGAEGHAPKTGAPSLMRTLMRTTVGIMALGVDAFSAFARTSLERGQQMQTDAQKLLGRYGDNAKVQAKAAQASRNNLTQQAWTTLEENLQALKGMLVPPDSEHETTGPTTAIAKPAMQGEQENDDSSPA